MEKVQAQATILAGGQGTRMRSFTHEPKALLPVHGRPLLAHQLEWLQKAGFEEVFLCLGYRADRVREVFKDGSEYGVSLIYQVEESPRGTAGAVRDLGSAITGDLLVLYGDLIVDFDARSLMRRHAETGAAATLVVRPTDHPEDSDLADVDDDGKISWIGRLNNAPESAGERLGCCAVWVVRPALTEYAPLHAPSDFARDVFPKALASGERLEAHRIESGARDIGTPERYARYCEESA
ncbi:MAG: hypothetical protein COB53_00220 [Elusimicrobia bacterium]|nr:MAG: hypothetical protein COB53_00220 [Elusimicrobiota bacterium]